MSCEAASYLQYMIFLNSIACEIEVVKSMRVIMMFQSYSQLFASEISWLGLRRPRFSLVAAWQQFSPTQATLKHSTGRQHITTLDSINWFLYLLYFLRNFEHSDLWPVILVPSSWTVDRSHIHRSIGFRGVLVFTFLKSTSR